MIVGLQPGLSVDALFINAPLKNYDVAPRYNDFTLPVLGLGYIATYAKQQGFNVGVLDAEALGLGISQVVALVNALRPRWVGLNLLAPTYRYSVDILRQLDPAILVMLGGHQAKALPQRILHDSHLPRIDALVLGEGEYRVAALLEDEARRTDLPAVFWKTPAGVIGQSEAPAISQGISWLAPDIHTLPLVDRTFLVQDPFTTEQGDREANLVGSRGCPYDCSFCGAAVSANPDISIRTRLPEHILGEMEQLAQAYQVSVFRFVDDLFLASPPFMKQCLGAFAAASSGSRFAWDATGRINVLSRAPDSLLDLMKEAGCREVALGIESGSERLLSYMGKRITPAMTRKAVQALTSRGINVKGYVILGFPTETQAEVEETVQLIRDLWSIADHQPGTFRCSAFEFRPYPGTPEWHRLLATGRYQEDALLHYESVDLTNQGQMRAMLDRDEFNFSVGLQFGEVPVERIRDILTTITVEQKQRLASGPDHVQRINLGQRA
jgi:radical SAM superfamily enzyme YgiQ (UPF0313 family)